MAAVKVILAPFAIVPVGFALILIVGIDETVSNVHPVLLLML